MVQLAFLFSTEKAAQSDLLRQMQKRFSQMAIYFCLQSINMSILNAVPSSLKTNRSRHLLMAYSITLSHKATCNRPLFVHSKNSLPAWESEADGLSSGWFVLRRVFIMGNDLRRFYSK